MPRIDRLWNAFASARLEHALAAAAVGSALFASPAVGQNGQTTSATAPAPTSAAPTTAAQPAAPAGPRWPEFTPTWTDGEIQKMAEALIGYWTTTSAVADATGAGSSAFTLDIRAVPVQGLENALYAEATRVDDPGKPFRTSIMSFYKAGDGYHLRTYEMRLRDFEQQVFAGMGHVPEAFPKIGLDGLVATMDLVVKPTANGFGGQSPHPYPTAVNGAVSMTGGLAVAGDTLTTSDKGFDAAGKVVWGGEGQGYTFSRGEDPHKVERKANGLISITFAHPEGERPSEGDRLHVHYTGWLDDGMRFDSSRPRDRVFQFPYPPRLIEGWNQSLDDVTAGTRRKLVIPSELGYGQRGQPQAKIPENATLIFEIEVVLVQKPEAAPEPAPAPEAGAEAQPAGGSNQ